MSRSNDPGHFFQTSTSLSESARKASKSKNTSGNPIKLPSKLLAVTADPQDDNNIYVAESAGNVKKIALESGKVLATYSGPTAPLTSLCISTTSNTLFAGCWDKSIWSWSCDTRKVVRRYQGHSDFVKVVITTVLDGKEVLISGSADASIVVWDISTGEKLRIQKGHARGVLALAVDGFEEAGGVLFSAGSDREIRRWELASEVVAESLPILAHETSVDAIRFDGDGDIWTASADKSAKCLSRSRKWEVDTELAHPDFVRDVVIDEDGGWVITACRDEEVRVWEKGSGRLHHTFSGHFEEVTGLVLLSGQRVVSISIDATVRQWSLKAQDLAKAVQEAEDETAGKVKETEKKEGMLTAEEEAELAELMEDSE